MLTGADTRSRRQSQCITISGNTRHWSQCLILSHDHDQDIIPLVSYFLSVNLCVNRTKDQENNLVRGMIQSQHDYNFSPSYSSSAFLCVISGRDLDVTRGSCLSTSSPHPPHSRAVSCLPRLNTSADIDCKQSVKGSLYVFMTDPLTEYCLQCLQEPLSQLTQSEMPIMYAINYVCQKQDELYTIYTVYSITGLLEPNRYKRNVDIMEKQSLFEPAPHRPDYRHLPP